MSPAATGGGQGSQPEGVLQCKLTQSSCPAQLTWDGLEGRNYWVLWEIPVP